MKEYTIEECKTERISPKRGQAVRICTLLPGEPKIKVKELHVTNRIEGNGIFWDFVAGSSGDYWWVKHGDNVAIYLYKEVTD